MRKFVLSSLLIFAALQFAFAQTPTLGTYLATSIATAGGNTIVTPSIAPINAISTSAYTSTNFKGLLQVSPATGVLTVTNAYPSGVYNITIRAYNGSLSTTTTFLLTVNNNGCSKGHFNGTGTLNAPSSPETLNVGDFNGDGKQDLVIPDGGNGVFIRLGDGTGGFSGSTNVIVGSAPKSIAIGDFNGDGKQDFVAALGGGSSAVSVMLGNGSGGSISFSSIPTGQRPLSVATGDFNNDGKLDFLAANFTGNTISVRLGNGAGGFTGTLNIPVGNGPRTVATGDFNGDGNQDFAVTNYFNGNVSIKLGDGTGNFTGATLVTAGPNPFGLAVADFNKDNKPDLVVANFNSNSFSIRLGDGAGGFTGTQDMNGVNGTQNVSIGDFNSDGNLDLASSNFNFGTISVFLGNGAGGFAAPSTTSVGAGAYSVAVGDFNNDGNQDFATANYLDNTASVRLGTVSEINVQGNNNTIPDGNTGISATDFTNLGTIVTGGNISRSYTIQNTGADSLIISSISFTGPDAASFMVSGISLPTKIPPASSGTFNVTFTTGSTGNKDATLSIINDDCNESTYDFAIRGVAVDPPVLGTYPATNILVTGGNTTITPSSAPTTVTTLTAFTSTNFKGLLHVDPATGIVTITNAHPAGTYTVTVGVASATTSFVLTVNNPIFSQGMLSARTTLAIGPSPRAVAVGDFNNDGKQDIATANSTAQSVSIRLGNGAGGFSGTTSVTVGTNPQYIVTGDFNGDGKQDVATANANSNNVSICIGDGTGGFTVITTIATGTSPAAIAITDFNKDGKQDLAITNGGTNNVSIRLGNGAGGFINSPDIILSGSPRELVAGDFNNDGNPDLAIAIYSNNTVSVRFGNGSGGFSGATNLAVGSGPYPIVLSDFNNDGKQDFAVGNLFSNDVSIRLGDGAGNFGGAANVFVGRNPVSLATADFNGDGKPDFAVVNELDSTISTRLGNGAGGFTAIANITTGYIPASVTVGNFNGDNQTDLISTSLNGSYLWSGVVNEINVSGNSINITDGDNTPDSLDFTDFGNVADRLIRTYTIQNTGSGNLTISNIGFNGTDSSLFNVSNIALPAIVAVGSSVSFNVSFVPTTAGLKSAAVVISNNDCDEAIYNFSIQGTGVAASPTLGTYPSGNFVQTGGSTTTTPSVTPTNSAVITAYTTTNFKGLLQANPATGAVSVTNAHPAGTYLVTVKTNGITSVSASFNLVVTGSGCSQAHFRAATSVSAGNNVESVAVGDFNGDSRQDLVIVNAAINTISIRLGNGAGGFSGNTEVPVGGRPGSVVIGDFNGDGKQDLAVGNFDSRTISIRLGTGTGGFTGVTSIPVAGGPNGSAALAIGDFNADGKQDLASTNYGVGSVSIRLGDGTGGFSSAPNVAVSSNCIGIAVGDFNNDGKSDFVTANYYSDDLSVRLQNSSGGFISTTISGLTSPIAIVTGDFNDDNNLDLAITTYANSVVIFLGNGTGGFTRGNTITTASTPSSIALGDFNGDGKQDLITANTNSSNVSVCLGNGTGSFTNISNVLVMNGVYPSKIAVGDFNGDGRQDIVTSNYNGSSAFILMGAFNAISVKGNNNQIANGSTTTDSANYTYMGTALTSSSLTRNYTIQNTGTDTLRVDSIAIRGVDSLLFAKGGISLPTFLLPGTSRTFTITFSPTDGGFKEARVLIYNNNCSESTYGFVIKGSAICTNLSANNVWLGITADWNTPGNWSLGFVPNGCGVAVVNAGVPFMPQISTNASCYSLTLNNGATFTVTSTGNLTITGP